MVNRLLRALHDAGRVPLRALLWSHLHSGGQRRCSSGQVVVLSLWAQHHMAAVGSVVSRVGWLRC